LKGLYNLVFVALFNQGPWYYGVSMFVSNLVIAIAIDDVLARFEPKRTSTWRSEAAAMAGYAVLAGYCATIFLNQVARTGAGQGLGAIVNARQELRDMVLAAGGNRFIEMNDGELTYVTGMPALSGIGLALDPEAVAARKQGRFLELAANRNFRLILAVGSYREELDRMVQDLRDGKQPPQFGMRGSEFDHVTLKPVAVDSPTGVEAFRIDLRPQPTGTAASTVMR
jgi:hypothetical protein